ncbi:hypothetical protein POTOM_040124 [Populus tomentosa]|uniref:Uncharacterized protein n=1 Tax=Populus tomentosa TaxID=118781 RepID=A0A8X8CK37_POPTO|nr:hypothetical protein POTOM_040124 [Populus tomentosa]
MSCYFLLIPTRFPTLSSYNKDIISATLPGFSSFSCLRNGRRSNSSATCISKRRRLGCKCQLADLAPVTSAAYGVILLGGGLFAYCIFVNEVGKSGSKGSLFGGLTGAALMGTVTFAQVFVIALYLVKICDLKMYQVLGNYGLELTAKSENLVETERVLGVLQAQELFSINAISRLNSAFGSAEDSNEFISIPGLFLSAYIVAVAALLKMVCGDGFDFCRRFALLRLLLKGIAYFLMQAPETKAIGDSLGFGSAFLSSSVFGKSFLCSECPRNTIGSYPKIDSFWSSASFIYLCTVCVHLRLFTAG